MTSSAISRASLGFLVLWTLTPGRLLGAPAQMLEGAPPLLASLPMEAAREESSLAPVLFHDARLGTMVADLQTSSPTARAMLLAIRRAGYPLVFGSFQDLAEEMRLEYGTWDPARKRTVGYMAPIVRATPGPGSPLRTVKMLIAVNLDRLDELFAEGREQVADPAVPWEEIQRLETLSVLAHEIVHAFGLAVSGGDPHLGCPDPQEGETPEIACVVIGENLVRRELGAPLDWGYGLASMPTLMGRYAEAERRRERLREIALNPLLPRPRLTGFAPTP